MWHPNAGVRAMKAARKYNTGGDGNGYLLWLISIVVVICIADVIGLI